MGAEWPIQAATARGRTCPCGGGRVRIAKQMSSGPHFRFWVRKGPGEDPTYSVRFEVRKGKGLLRVARPGVLVDPPARQSGYEERLTPAQVRASRFLHVWDAGRKRQGYVLSRLTDEVLMELQIERWAELGIESDGGFCWLVPRGDADPSMGDQIVDELTDLAETAVITSVEEIVEDEPSEVGATVPLQSMDEYTQAFGKATTLVRYMRREKLRDQESINHLKGRVEELEAKLDAAQKREVQLRTRVARYQRRLKARESVNSRD